MGAALSAPAGSVGALVLVGGRARRFGGAAKPLVELGGSTPWERTLVALRECGVAPVVAAGPGWGDAGPGEGRAPTGVAATVPVGWVREDPPFGGPVAAIAAGLPALAGTEWALLLAGDLVHPADVVRTLCDAVGTLCDAVRTRRDAVRADEAAGVPGERRTADLGGHDSADRVDAIVFRAEGRAQWLAGAYRVEAVRAALAAIAEPSAAAARELLGGLPTRWIPDEDGITADIDTPADLERARAALADPSAHHDEEPR
ncbi:NTP transferase domain-containing protein [Microbacterium sp. 13-71-7]|uniref:molybdenum cofactor guanylyltransferase n=1 Tax=Microbacterium sp. 13-71-7 TaxID=1970399 RepID=UPI0025CC1985|nr:NTP transferase domain-containing protein [Microbacterium sp. 13-71-7]